MTIAEVLAVDVETQKPLTLYVTVPRTYTSNKSLMNKVKKILDTETVKAAYVISKKDEVRNYEMTEDDFIRHATKVTQIKNKEEEKDL